MHELRIAEDLTEMVISHAMEAGLSSVERVNICFGQFIQIVPDLFETAFREASMGTIAEGAELSVEIIPAELRCRLCGSPYAPEGDFHSCSICGSDDIELVHGKELFIKSIEGE